MAILQRGRYFLFSKTEAMMLNNKVAIVTGASRGIGEKIARIFSTEGANVVVNYAFNRLMAERIADELRSNGHDAVAVGADVSKPQGIKTLFDAAIDRFGRVDILVNNAGGILYKSIHQTTDEEFDRVFDINVKGVFYALREAAARLSDGGRIINLSSSVTRLMLPTYGTYSASKAAVEQLTRVFAKEIGYRGITVNSVSPGPTNTELFMEGKSDETVRHLASMAALKRIGEPDDIARAVLLLASDDAAWITGQNLGVNGGFA